MENERADPRRYRARASWFHSHVYLFHRPQDDRQAVLDSGLADDDARRRLGAAVSLAAGLSGKASASHRRFTKISRKGRATNVHGSQLAGMDEQRGGGAKLARAQLADGHGHTGVL